MAEPDSPVAETSDIRGKSSFPLLGVFGYGMSEFWLQTSALSILYSHLLSP